MAAECSLVVARVASRQGDGATIERLFSRGADWERLFRDLPAEARIVERTRLTGELQSLEVTIGEAPSGHAETRYLVLPGRARWITLGHILRQTEKRPFVQLKMAVDANGRIARGDGKPAWVTGPEARADGHLLRAEADAILVGGMTVRADDPELTCRLPGLEERTPLPFVMSSKRDLPPDSHLARRGAEVLRGTVHEVLADLGSRGINRLMVEGGAAIARSFLDAGVVDEIQLFRSPSVIGPQGVEGLTMAALQPFAVREEERLGSDTLTVYALLQMGEVF